MAEFSGRPRARLWIGLAVVGLQPPGEQTQAELNFCDCGAISRPPSGSANRELVRIEPRRERGALSRILSAAPATDAVMRARMRGRALQKLDEPAGGLRDRTLAREAATWGPGVRRRGSVGIPVCLTTAPSRNPREQPRVRSRPGSRPASEVGPGLTGAAQRTRGHGASARA